MDRDKRIDIRVSPGELADIKQRALKTERSVSDFVRAAALDEPIAIKTYKHLDPHDLAQLKRLGNLLNQIAAKMHTVRIDGSTAFLLHSVLDDLRKIVLRELGETSDRRLP